MKVSKRDILLLVGFIGILLGFGTFYWVFMPAQEKVEAMKAENIQLRQQITDLTIKTNNKETYMTEMERMAKEIEDIYQVFPVNVKAEDVILMAINQELVSPMIVESINIEQLAPVSFADQIAPAEEHDYTYDLGENDVLGVDDEPMDGADNTTASEGSAEEEIDWLYNRKATFNYGVSYEGLKRSIQHIVDQPNRMAIETLTVTFDDSTGLLVGSTTLNMYLAPYQMGKEYVQPDFSSVLLGTDNIFGTISLHGEAGLPDVGDMETEGGAGETENQAGAENTGN